MDSVRRIRRLPLTLLFSAALMAPVYAGMQIGERAPAFSLLDASGVQHALDDYKGKIVVLEFWSFKCAVSLAYEDRMSALKAKYRSRGVVFLAVDSNKNESQIEVRRNAENLNLSIPVLLDLDGRLADSLGATHTPSLVIFDGSGLVRYRGAIDNNRLTGEKGRIPYAEETLDALIAGKAVPQSETKVFGCSIRK